MSFKRINRTALAMAVAIFVLASCVSGGKRSEMTTQPVVLPAVTSALQIIHAERHNTGGFSALWVSPDCTRMVTVSDYSQAKDALLDQPVRRSGWYQVELHFDEHDRLSDMTFVNRGQLRDLDASILQGAVESMAWDNSGFLFSFDDSGTIYRYEKPESLTSTDIAGTLNSIPVVAYTQSNFGHGNLGLESITLLQDGDLLALWETKSDEIPAKGRLLKLDGSKLDLSYVTGASPGGATTLSDGSLLILEKRWLGAAKGQRLRLVRINPNDISKTMQQQEISGEVLLDQISTLYDNNEGIASCVRDGKEWVFVITDDNGDWNRANVEDKGRTRQRTLLLQFSLDELISRVANR